MRMSYPSSLVFAQACRLSVARVCWPVGVFRRHSLPCAAMTANESIEPTGGRRSLSRRAGAERKCLISLCADREQVTKSVHLYCVKLILAALFLALACAAHGAEAGTNLLAIYLLDRPLAQPWPKLDQAHLKDLKPVSPPVLADPDFVSFDLKKQAFVITGAAAKRLSLTIYSLARKDAPGWGDQVPYVHATGDFELIPVPAPFVLHAGGEPVYAGAFYCSASSTGFPGPVILSWEPFIKTNVAPNAKFSFFIQMGYPGEFPGTPDPRRDSRIAAAVQKLFARKR